MTLRSTVNRLTSPLRRARGGDVMTRDRAASATPLCAEFGYSRGTPIDRHYIEAFLEKHSADIRGRVLEIGDDTYSRRFGGERITRQDVLHIQSGHPQATIIGDLADPGALPQQAFDCIILSQTLHLIFDINAAVEHVHAALKPGGVALITVPGISPLDRGEWKASWYWSLTDLAVERLLSGPFNRGKVTISTHGNLYAATAFLHGAAVEEVHAAKLAHFDPAYPVTVTARAVA
jgi:SAM-dependent methyltransferase